MISVQIYPTTAELLEHLAPATVQLARAAVEQYGLFTLALSGGSTPQSFYKLLARAPWKKRFPWSETVFFWSDERVAGPDSPESNYRMAKDAMLGATPISQAHVIRMRGEEPHLEKAAQEYQDEIQAVLGNRGLRFDLILLGMGDDGHVASLFPGTAALDETEKLVVANRIDSKGTSRLTFTYPLINRARSVFLLVTGERKAQIVKDVFLGTKDYPVRRVRPADGQLSWWLDRATAASLSKKQVDDFIDRYQTAQ